MTATDAAVLNADAPSDVVTAQQFSNLATPQTSSSDSSNSNGQPSQTGVISPSGVEFTLTRGTTASQLLSNVDGRTREEDSRLGFIGRWFARRRGSETVQEEGR